MKFLTHDSKISCIDDTGKEVGKIIFPQTGNAAIIRMIGKCPKSWERNYL